MSRDTLLRLVTVMGALYFAMRFFVPGLFGTSAPLAQYHEQITTGLIAVVYMSVGLGILGILLAHGGKVLYLRTGWRSSLVLLAGLGGMLCFGFGDWYASSYHRQGVRTVQQLERFVESSNHPEKLSLVQRTLLTLAQQSRQEKAGVDDGNLIAETASALTQSNVQEQLGMALHASAEQRYQKSFASQGYQFLYTAIFVPLGAAMFSLLACYIATAAFRAFRIRSLESGLMMLAALLVVLGQLPWGQMLWSRFPDIRLWLLEVPSAASFRAIDIGSSIGALLISWRLLLGGSSTAGGAK
jgi:hypothetical protein